MGEVLDVASRQLGPAFDEVVANSKLWLNGEPTDRDASVGESDEIVTPERVLENVSRLRDADIGHRVEAYPGGHRIERDVLARVMTPLVL